jgi:hypothetical protein
MSPGRIYIFDPKSRAREYLPIIARDAINKPASQIESITTKRIFPGDRVKLVRDNGDGSVYVQHPCINGFGITFKKSLVESDQPPATIEL